MKTVPSIYIYIYIYIYYSVFICWHIAINSFASAPLNATKIAVMKVSHGRVVMFGPEFYFGCINIVFWRVFLRGSAHSG